MLDPKRQNLIKKISELRGNSKIIAYLTSDRAPLNTRIAEDVVSLLQRHILIDTERKKVSLFLYTRGGDMIAPLKIVNLLRSHYNEFEILITHYAQSAGTLISLGADSIIMTRLAELSPVDPTTTHPFNPTVASQNPSVPAQPRPINVEDVNSYFLFATEKAKVNDKDMDKVYSYLINNAHKDNAIHPLSLGNVYRGYRMARKLAERMLKMHYKGFFRTKRIAKLVDALTGKIPTHDYPIFRDEARELGLKVEYASTELESLMFELLSNYTNVMNIGRPFNPVEILGSEQNKEFSSIGAFVESVGVCDTFTFKGIIKRDADTPPRISMNIVSSKWERI
ncbi:MAG: hypothetical protein WC514_02110 [Candidatus Paceibacterota bacterium]